MRPAALLVVAACSSAPTASLDITLQRLDRTAQCWSNVTTAPPDLESYGITDTCAAPASKVLQGGVDRLRFAILYRDIEFDTDKIDAPTLALRLDGLAQTTTFDIVEQRVSRKLAVLAEFDAPARAAAELQLDVNAAAGLETTFPSDDSTRISLLAPTLSAAASGCPASGRCTLAGGVGATAIDVALSTHEATAATLTWTIDGIPQPESRTLMLAPVGGVVVARDFVPVPLAASTWQITAHANGIDATVPEIQLVAPTISADLTSCAAPCAVAAGSIQNIRISAPLGIRDPKATLSTFVNGVPSLVDVQVDLTTTDIAAGTIEGVKQVTVPAPANAAWSIDVRVSGFRAPGIAATIAP